MRRATSLLLCALCGLVASAQARDLPPVTYESKAINADAALREIGKQLGVSISVSAELAHEVMVIRLKDASAEATMAKFAEVLNAEVTKTDTGWRFDRTGALRTSLQQADRARLAEAIKQWLVKPSDGRFQTAQVALESSAPAMAAPQEPDPAEEARQKILNEAYKGNAEAQSKIWKAVRAALDPNFIASIDLGGRVVFSTSPTALQRAMSPAVTAAMREFNTGAQSRVQALIKAGFDKESIEQMQMEPLARMLLIFERKGPYSWEITAKGISPEHKTTIQNSFEPNALDQMGLMMMFDPNSNTKAADTKLKLDKPDTVIPASGSFKSFSMFINSVTQGAPPPMTDSKEMLDFFRNPVKFDPLSQSPSAALLALATDQKANLIADVSDEAFVLESAAMYNRELSLKAAVSAFEQIGTCQLASKDGWVTMSPTYPSLSGVARLNRAALQALIEKEDQTGGVSVMDKGVFLLTYPEYSETLWQIYQFLAAPSLNESMFEGGMGQDSNDAYRFFASLNPPEREALLAGQSVPYSRLTGISRARFERCLDNIRSIEGKNPDIRGLFTAPVPDEQDLNQEPPFADITDLPLQAMTQSIVALSSDSEIVVRPVTTDFNFFMMQTMTAETLAMMKQMLSSPESAGFAGMMPKLDRLRPGTRTRLDVKFAVTRQFGGRHLLSGVQMSGDKAGVREADLPSSFLEALHKAEEAYRGMMQGDGGAIPAEPPPGDGTTPP